MLLCIVCLSPYKDGISTKEWQALLSGLAVHHCVKVNASKLSVYYIVE